MNGGNRNWNKLNVPDNLIGLCKDCHKDIHRQMSKKRENKIISIENVNQLVLF